MLLLVLGLGAVWVVDDPVGAAAAVDSVLDAALDLTARLVVAVPRFLAGIG